MDRISKWAAPPPGMTPIPTIVGHVLSNAAGVRTAVVVARHVIRQKRISAAGVYSAGVLISEIELAFAARGVALDVVYGSAHFRLYAEPVQVSFLISFPREANRAYEVQWRTDPHDPNS